MRNIGRRSRQATSGLFDERLWSLYAHLLFALLVEEAAAELEIKPPWRVIG